MFGMSFSEILIIAVVAVLFLGPDKLPTAMVQIAKFFKSFKSTINEAKQSIEEEVKIQELKDEALQYKKEFDKGVEDTRKKLTLEELDELKKAKEDVNESINSLKEDMTLVEKKDEKKTKKEEKQNV